MGSKFAANEAEHTQCPAGLRVVSPSWLVPNSVSILPSAAQISQKLRKEDIVPPHFT